MKSRTRILKTFSALGFICAVFACPTDANAQATGRVFVVNDVGDTIDAIAGDGSCSDSKGKCTLRAAVEESNATIARDAIIFNLPQPSVINLILGQISINRSVDIVGPGARRLTIQRSESSGTPDFRVFYVASGLVMSFRNLTIRNGAGTSGGAILVDPETIAGLYDSAVVGNRAVDGGAISVRQSQLTILRSLIGPNQASNHGGGIQIVGSGAGVTLTNSTITGNSASVGGGINNEGALILINNTISQNAATTSASSIFSNKSGSIKVLNTIIGRDTNQAPTGLSGSFVSLGSNVITDARNGTGFTNGVNGDQVSDNNVIDPRLANLADNGGQTDTLALFTGSPAIDRADSCVISGFCPNLQGTLIRGSKTSDNIPDRRYLEASWRLELSSKVVHRLRSNSPTRPSLSQHRKGLLHSLRKHLLFFGTREH